MISASSVVGALFFYTAGLMIACVARSLFPTFVKRGGASVLLLLAAVATLRLFLPFEIPVISHLVRSWGLMGNAVRLIRTYPETMKLLVAVWVGGIVWFLCRDVLALCRAYQTSSKYERGDSAYAKEIAEKFSIRVPIVVSPHVGVPYAEGIIRHTIYLSELKFPEEEIGFILRHEAQHIRNHDSIIKFCFRIMLIVMWWNPFAHWFWCVLDDLLELRCDGKLIKQMDKRERRVYADMLEGMDLVLTGKERMSPIAVDELFETNREKFMRLRLDMIRYGSSEPPRSVGIVVQCVLVLLFCASYLVIVQPMVMPWEERFEEKAGVYYNENYNGPDAGEEISSAFICKGLDGRYQLYIGYEFSRFLTEDEVNSSQYQNLYIFEEEEDQE